MHDVPIVFPSYMTHAEVARGIAGNAPYQVASAGECAIAEIRCNPREKPVSEMVSDVDNALKVRWKCWGRSVTLAVASNPDVDERILDRQYR